MRLLGMLVLTCAVAYAQPKTKSTELFEQGRALAAAGKLAEACSKFDESYQLDRAPGTALNFGDCLEKLGQLRRAWQMFDGAWRDFARDSDGRADYAKKRASDISAKLVAITVNVADPAIPGLVIEIDGQVVAAQAVIEDRFPPGEITVTARAPGKTELSARTSGAAGATVAVDIPAELGGGSSASTGPTPGSRDKTRVRVALITGGVGLVSLGASAVLGLSAKSKYDDGLADCPVMDGTPRCATLAQKQVLDEAASRANVATGFAIAGAFFVAAGVVLYVTAPRESLQVAPTATASSVGLSLSGAF